MDVGYNFFFVIFFYQLIAYFSERMISEETLRRNAVMQMSGDKVPKLYHLEHCTTYHFYFNVSPWDKNFSTYALVCWKKHS